MKALSRKTSKLASKIKPRTRTAPDKRASAKIGNHAMELEARIWKIASIARTGDAVVVAILLPWWKLDRGQREDQSRKTGFGLLKFEVEVEVKAREKKEFATGQDKLGAKLASANYE